MRARLVAGNWKMHGSRAANASLLDGIVSAAETVECAVCVPFPYLEQVSARLKGTPLAWGAQDVSAHAQGAYTGEVSAAMLAEFGCRYVLVGHSERRQHHAETDALVAAKFVAAQAAGLVPVLCVGETLAERDAGQTEAVVGRQLQAVVAAAGAESFSRAVLAYEPVWAIGTGEVATPEDAQEVCGAIRERVAESFGAPVAEAVRILYGGSVKSSNVAAIMGKPDVDGALIGGASLDPDEFVGIVRFRMHPPELVS